jgi:hypothetical protein
MNRSPRWFLLATATLAVIPVSAQDTCNIPDIANAYFSLTRANTQRELAGPLQLLSGRLDARAGTITLPLYRGRVRNGNRTVYYILTDTTDENAARALGINHGPKLAFTAFSDRAVRTAQLQRDGTLLFDSGTVDFSPERRVTPGPTSRPFPPTAAQPGAIGDTSYSPLVRVVNAGNHIYNAPIIAASDDPAQLVTGLTGAPNYRFVHDNAAALTIHRTNPLGSTVTMRLTPGFSFGRPVLYLSTDASADVPAALEGAVYAQGLEDIPTGDDASGFSSVESLFLILNGATGCSPQRQGLFSALTEGRPPLNVLGAIPTLAEGYSPLWDVHMAEWTQSAIDRGFRSRLTDELHVRSMAEGGFLTAPGGSALSSTGFVVNCPIVSRFF